MNFETKKHSLEHVMVLAVRRLYGNEIRLGVGPVIENGFYQDFDYSIPQESFSAIEKEMCRILEEDLPFVHEAVPIADAIEYFQSAGQEYKVQLLQDIQAYGTTKADRNKESEEDYISGLSEKGLVNIYTIGSHRDLCRGPHVRSSGRLKDLAFCLDRVTGAYWRGNEKNPMLCRLYALAFENQQLLDRFILMREEAKKRDHRKVGEELDLFFFHETAPGMPYWLPKGMRLKNLLITYWRQYHDACGYQEISAPLLNKKELWEISGHLKHYKEDMIMCRFGGEEEWALKPMNCANAMLVWKHKPRSYRDLPLRLSDTDILHRNERSGSLAGLFRARCFCQDDSHNFVAENQIGDEVRQILKIVRDFYGVFGLSQNVRLYLSTRPDEYMGDLETWNFAELQLSEILKSSGFEHGIKEKDGAFYGPKIDIHLMDALGREWQCGTVQLDFQLPRNFNLEYTDQDGLRKIPAVIHRVIYGSIERFIGIIIEHFAGRLPFWVAPVQVRVIPVNNDCSSFVEEVVNELSAIKLDYPVRFNEIRFEVDNREESLSRRIRDAEVQKIPVCLVIGNKEKNCRSVNLRTKAGEKLILLANLAEELENVE